MKKSCGRSVLVSPQSNLIVGQRMLRALAIIFCVDVLALSSSLMSALVRVPHPTYALWCGRRPAPTGLSEPRGTVAVLPRRAGRSALHPVQTMCACPRVGGWRQARWVLLGTPTRAVRQTNTALPRTRWRGTGHGATQRNAARRTTTPREPLTRFCVRLRSSTTWAPILSLSVCATRLSAAAMRSCIALVYPRRTGICARNEMSVCKSSWVVSGQTGDTTWRGAAEDYGGAQSRGEPAGLAGRAHLSFAGSVENVSVAAKSMAWPWSSSSRLLFSWSTPAFLQKRRVGSTPSVGSGLRETWHLAKSARLRSGGKQAQ